MNRNEEIGEVLTQGYLFIDNIKYNILEVKNDSILKFTLVDDVGRYRDDIEVHKNTWSSQIKLSYEDEIRIKLLRKLGYAYLKVLKNRAMISSDSYFKKYDVIYCLDSLPQGVYEIDEDCNVHYLGSTNICIANRVFDF